MMTTVKFAKTNPNAIIPTKRDEDAGFDLYACFEERGIMIQPFSTKLVPTEIAAACDKDYYIQIEERGSTGSHGIKVSSGIIDSGYRDSIFVAITNCNSKPIIIDKGTKEYTETDEYIYYPYSKAIAQMIVHQLPEVEVEEYTYEELKAIPSTRGIGSLGSSGK